MTCVLGISLMLTLASAAGWAATIGPLLPQPVVAVYLVADGQPCSVRLAVHSRETDRAPRFLVRAFDPDERLVLWRYVEYADPETLAATEPHEGIELREFDGQMPEGETLLEASLPVESAGVHQVRISTDSREIAVELELERKLPYGVCSQNGDFLQWEQQPPVLHAYIPPRAEELQLRGGPVVVRDEQSAEVARHASGKGDETNAPVDRTDVVWQFEFPERADWSLRAAGMPLILCDSEQAARAIHASVEVLPDGTVVCHKFQVRIAEVLPRVLAPENVGLT